MPQIDIAAFYRFARLANHTALQQPLRDLCDAHGVKGILLIAAEGINGTIAAPHGHMDAVLSGIRAITGLYDIDPRLSHDEEMPFLRLKVRLKAEIVTIGAPEADPLQKVGTYVEPENWNALIADPDVYVLDTRNSYEYRIGTFAGAVDPQTQAFTEFPEFVKDNLDPAKQRKVAMFCTGGIRCEKASSFMLQHGFEEVYHLKGGILNYLEKIPPEESLWQGACFVFDRRAALGPGLAVENIDLCYGCLAPLTAQDRHSKDFEEGVSCPHCASLMTPLRKAAARERHRQVKLAEARGAAHLGPRYDCD